MKKYLDIVNSISTSNKYYRIYERICEKAKLRALNRSDAVLLNIGNIEAHHIVPKSFKLGGDNDTNNLVFLTCREHFVAHKCLEILSRNTQYHKSMLYAIVSFSMSVNGTRILNSCQYNFAKKCAMVVNKNKIPWNKGMTNLPKLPCTPDRAERISESRKNTKKIKCSYCEKISDPGNISRFHNEKCVNHPDLTIRNYNIESRSKKSKESYLKSISNNTYSKPKPEYGNYTCVKCSRQFINKGGFATHQKSCK